MSVLALAESTRSARVLNAGGVYNADMTPNKDQPKRRRRMRFNITALLVVTMICAILFAWWRDRTQLQQRLEVELGRAAMEREMAISQRTIARMTQQMARLRVEAAQAALRNATSRSTSDHEAGKND